jgi:hypothetical protein
MTQSDFIPLKRLKFMATPAQLVRMVSSATGVPLPTIVDIDRKLVQGNLRTKGGRGLHAAKMTPLDAARLLTALLASPHANTAVEAVKRYTLTYVDKERSSVELFGTAGLDDLVALPARHSFVYALTVLIASCSGGALAKLMAGSKDGWVPHIEVFAFTRVIRGRIRISGLPNEMTASVEYAPESDGIKPRRGRKISASRIAFPDSDAGDLEQSRRITERTILPIADLLAAENQNERT